MTMDAWSGRLKTVKEPIDAILLRAEKFEALGQNLTIYRFAALQSL